MAFRFGAVLLSVLSLSSCLFWGASSDSPLSFLDITVNDLYLDIQYSSGCCYYAAGPAGIRVFDVSVPGDSRELAPLEVTAPDELSLAIAFDGTMGCVISDRRLTVFDLNGDGTAVKRGTLDTVSGSSSDIAVDRAIRKKILLLSDTVYLHSLSTDIDGNSVYDLVFADISDPDNPAEVYREPELEAADFAVSGNYFFYTLNLEDNDGDSSTWRRQLRVMDITDISSPVDVPVTYLPGGRSMVINGDVLYEISDGAVYAMDISSPDTPVVVGRLLDDALTDVAVNIQNSSTHPVWPAVTSSRMFYVQLDAVVNNISISDPTALSFSADRLMYSLPLTGGNRFLSVAAGSEYLYILSDNGLYEMALAGY